MNPELQERLVRYLDKLEKAADTVGGAAEREVPLAIQEWLNWHFMDSCFCAAVMLLLAPAVWLTARHLRGLALQIQDPEPRTVLRALLMIVMIAGPVVFLSFATHHARQAAKVYYAPRVVLVEEVARLSGLANGGAKK
jgi:hypothetical protein